MKNMPITLGFLCSKFFPVVDKFWGENFPIALRTKRTGFRYVLQRIYRNKWLKLTRLNLSHNHCKQQSRRINKKSTKSLEKNKLYNFADVAVIWTGPLRKSNDC